MKQKVIKVGNSYAVTMPKQFVKDVNLHVGSEVHVLADTARQTLTVQPSTSNTAPAEITPEFTSWLNDFNKRYKKVLVELAKK